MSQNECPTFEEVRSNLVLPERLVGLLGSPLESLGYKLQPADGYDVAGAVFKYYEARNGTGAKPLTLLYVENLEKPHCVNSVSPLGYLFSGKRNPLIVFSNGDHVHGAYNYMAEMWQLMGPESVRFYSTYEVGLLEREREDAAALARRVQKYLGISDQPAPATGATTATTTTPAAAPEKKKLPTDVIKIFISYSHDDEQYLGDDKSLVGILRGLAKDGAQFWSDKEIPVGSKWDDVIKQRIAESHIALVLVSQTFLDSPYCQNSEIPEFLKKAEREGLVIFPIMLSTCLWDEHEWLKERQFIPNDGVIDLEYVEAGKRMKLFIEIRKKLQEEIRKLRAAATND